MLKLNLRLDLNAKVEKTDHFNDNNQANESNDTNIIEMKSDKFLGQIMYDSTTGSYNGKGDLMPQDTILRNKERLPTMGSGKN